jgi:hypothetical protein
VEAYCGRLELGQSAAQVMIYGADFLVDVRKFVLTRAADELRPIAA